MSSDEQEAEGLLLAVGPKLGPPAADERSATTRNVIVTAAERTATHWHCDKLKLLLKWLNLTVERLEKQNKVTNLKVNKHSTVFSCYDVTGCRMRGPRISRNQSTFFNNLLNI